MSFAVGDIRKEFTQVFDVYWAIGVGVFALVVLLVLAFVVAFRARGNPDELPRGRDKNMPLELGYAFVIACVVGFLVYLTYTTMGDPGYRATAQGTSAGAPVRGAEVIDVTGARWNWRFAYRARGIVIQGTNRRIPTLTVPQSRPVTLRMRSVDVIHGIWIPERRFKQDVFPGRTTTMTLIFPTAGLQRRGGECGQYCGLLHDEMDFNVDVLPPAAYRAWARRNGR